MAGCLEIPNVPDSEGEAGNPGTMDGVKCLRAARQAGDHPKIDTTTAGGKGGANVRF